MQIWTTKTVFFAKTNLLVCLTFKQTSRTGILKNLCLIEKNRVMRLLINTPIEVLLHRIVWCINRWFRLLFSFRSSFSKFITLWLRGTFICSRKKKKIRNQKWTMKAQLRMEWLPRLSKRRARARRYKILKWQGTKIPTRPSEDPGHFKQWSITKHTTVCKLITRYTWMSGARGWVGGPTSWCWWAKMTSPLAIGIAPPRFSTSCLRCQKSIDKRLFNG